MKVLMFLGAAVGSIMLIGALIMAGFGIGIFSNAASAKYSKAVVGYKVTQATYNATNRIQANAWFNNTYQEIKGFQNQIVVLRDTYKTTPSPYNQINLQGAQLVCIQAVQDYNAAAQTITEATWLPPGLPVAIDSVTACT